MQRYFQTLSRIGAGLSTLGFLCWVLWRGSLLDVLGSIEPEPLFVFLVSLVFWIFVEFKESEEVIFRSSTKNDVRVAREILQYSRYQLREMLWEHHYGLGMDPRFLTEISLYLGDYDLGIVFFQDNQLDKEYSDFMVALSELVYTFSRYSAPEKIGARTLQSILLPEEYSDCDLLWPDHRKAQIEETNDKAKIAWEKLKLLTRKIKDRAPEAFDDPIENGWPRGADKVHDNVEKCFNSGG